MAKGTRQLVVAHTGGYETRIEKFNGRDHVVVPVVALVEGVVHAMNSATPELVTADEFSHAPGGWNGRPIFHGHPIRRGQPVSGNVPEVLEHEAIGVVFNAGITKNKLTMEAWIDIARAAVVAPELLQRVRDRQPIEISVGVFVETKDVAGTFAGKKYAGAWGDIVPDHLALLPSRETGACSVEMGCGVRAAQGAGMKVSIAQRILNLFKGALAAEDMTSDDLKRKLYDAIREKEPNLAYVDSYKPVTDPTAVVYCVQTFLGDYMTVMYEQEFTLAADGTVTLADTRVEVEPVTHYEAAKGSETPVAAAVVENAAPGSPCSCHKNGEPAVAAELPVEEINMLNETIVKALTAAKATPEQEAAVVAFIEGGFKAAEVVKEVTVEKEVVKEVAVEMTREQAVEKFGLGEAVKALSDRKAKTIAALVATGRCKMTAEQLDAKDQVELDQLVELAGSNVRAAIDFSAQAPHVETPAAEGEVAPMPSLRAAILAGRK